MLKQINKNILYIRIHVHDYHKTVFVKCLNVSTSVFGVLKNYLDFVLVLFFR